jgi:hypothetical protein
MKKLLILVLMTLCIAGCKKELSMAGKFSAHTPYGMLNVELSESGTAVAGFAGYAEDVGSYHVSGEKIKIGGLLLHYKELGERGAKIFTFAGPGRIFNENSFEVSIEDSSEDETIRCVFSKR